MNVLMVHNSVNTKGGDDVYVRGLADQGDRYGLRFSTVFAVETNKSIEFNYNGEVSVVSRCDASKYLHQLTDKLSSELINIQTNYSVSVANACVRILPTVKTTHATDTVCPGHLKFLRKSGVPCEITYSWKCLASGFSEGCCTRHPIRFLQMYRGINAENQELSEKYKAIVVMSEYIREQVIHAGTLGEKINVVPYSTPVYNGPVGTTDEKRHIVFAGRVAEIKGPHVMIRALVPVLKRYDNVVIDIVGDGPQRSHLMTLIADEGLENRVILHGWQDREQTLSKINSAYLVVFPSIYPEAFGIVGIEAMMRGKPVIGFDVGGVRTWLRSGETGILLQSSEHEKLRESVIQLLEDPALYKKFSTNAARVARREFSPDAHFAGLKNVYEKSLATLHV
jgi:glycosyltransferase involved in cell wall biosynthesis